MDEISIEAAQPRLDLNVLDELPSKRIQFGVLDLRDTEVEPVAMVRAAALVRRELADRAPVSARESASRARTTR